MPTKLKKNTNTENTLIPLLMSNLPAMTNTSGTFKSIDTHKKGTWYLSPCATLTTKVKESDKLEPQFVKCEQPHVKL
jgi:hypothetical protein